MNTEAEITHLQKNIVALKNLAPCENLASPALLMIQPQIVSYLPSAFKI